MMYTYKITAPDNMNARIACSIFSFIRQNTTENDTINLTYKNKIKNAKEILNWLEFSYYGYTDFTLDIQSDKSEFIKNRIYEIINENT